MAPPSQKVVRQDMEHGSSGNAFPCMMDVSGATKADGIVSVPGDFIGSESVRQPGLALSPY